MTRPSRLFRSSEKAQLGSALVTSAPIPDICFGPILLKKSAVAEVDIR
jgi:hypothetical protein